MIRYKTESRLTLIRKGFTSSDYDILASAKFIPVHRADTNNTFDTYPPRGVYFKSAESPIAAQFRSLFTFVDFGTSANAFLLQCGVRSEPSTAEMYELLDD